MNYSFPGSIPVLELFRVSRLLTFLSEESIWQFYVPHTMENTFIFSVKHSRKNTATRFYFLKSVGHTNHMFDVDKFKVFAKRIRKNRKRKCEKKKKVFFNVFY